MRNKSGHQQSGLRRTAQGWASPTRLLTALTLLAVAEASAADSGTARAILARGRLLAPVQLNGSVPCLMMLDLAARHPVLDPRVAAALRLAPTGDRVTGVDPLERPIESYTVSVELQPAPGVHHTDAALTLDLSALSAWLGTEVGGILPAHLPGYEVTLDFARPTVSWRPLPDAWLQSAGDDILNMTVSASGAPVVQALLDQQHLQPLQLDLACSTSLALPPKLVEQLRLPEDTPRMGFQETATQMLRLGRVTLGGTELAGPVCTLLPEDTPGRVGLPLLSRFRVTLNYEYGLCRFEPLEGNRMREPAVTGFGMTLHRIEQGYWRVRVAEHSPAARAGIRTGDYLLGAGGRPAGGLTYSAAVAFVGGAEGESRVFSMGRNAAGYQVELTSERLL